MSNITSGKKVNLKELEDSLFKSSSHLSLEDSINIFMRNLEKVKNLYEMPCNIGDRVYEVANDKEEGIHINEYEVQDASIKAVKYCDDWYDLYEFRGRIFFSKHAANRMMIEMQNYYSM